MPTPSCSREPVMVALSGVFSGTGHRPSMSRYSWRRRGRFFSHSSRVLAPSRKRPLTSFVRPARYWSIIASPGFDSAFSSAIAEPAKKSKHATGKRRIIKGSPGNHLEVQSKALCSNAMQALLDFQRPPHHIKLIPWHLLGPQIFDPLFTTDFISCHWGGVSGG